MITISITFTRAASSKTGIEPGFSTFWMLVWAIAIDDGRQRREKEQRRKRPPELAPAKPPCNLKSKCQQGPRLF